MRPVSSTSAQRPRASKGVAPLNSARHAILTLVLNARGHRRGSHVNRLAVGCFLCRCSTPEGIEGGRTRARRPAAARESSAQRPRASKGVAQWCGLRFVSQLGVLNARGHRRGSHANCLAAPWGKTQCSTPEGIEGGRTCRPAAVSWVAWGAQRPRASKGVAQRQEVKRALGNLCSTPEGIEGGRT